MVWKVTVFLFADDASDALNMNNQQSTDGINRDLGKISECC